MTKDTTSTTDYDKGDSNLCGVVLSGGISSRLGHDKAALHFDKDNALSLLKRSANLLYDVAGTVVISGRYEEGYTCIIDTISGCGPVSGIVSALEYLKGHAALVLSCDLPFMSTDVLHLLVKVRANRKPEKLLTAYQQADTGHIETLVAIYEHGALPLLKKALNQKKLKLSKIIPEDQQLLIPYTSADSLPFFNINYPADLEVARLALSQLKVNS